MSRSEIAGRLEWTNGGGYLVADPRFPWVHSLSPLIKAGDTITVGGVEHRVMWIGDKLSCRIELGPSPLEFSLDRLIGKQVTLRRFEHHGVGSES